MPVHSLGGRWAHGLGVYLDPVLEKIHSLESIGTALGEELQTLGSIERSPSLDDGRLLAHLGHDLR